jgi:hypothetical protein
VAVRVVTVVCVCSFHNPLQDAYSVFRASAYFRCALTSAGVTICPVLLPRLLRV